MPDLLLELRSEEIPARMQRKAAGDLRKMITDGLVEAGLTYEAAREYWTPRRLTLDLRGLTARSRDVSEEIKGPSTKAPPQAIDGFLRKAGLSDVDQAHIHSDPKKGDFYVAHISRPGRAAEDIIAELVPSVVRAFPWPKSMRWGPASAKPGSLRWVRPLQSIVCTFGPETEEPVVVDFEIDGIRSGNVTYGHRFHAPGAITVRRFEDYAAKLEAAKVVIDADRRKEIILADAKNLAFANGLDLVEDEGLLDEVSGLVEWPVVLLGTFEEDFLAIPAEVIRLTIRANQKCFVTRPQGGSEGLSNRFVVTANIEAKDHGKEIAHGNGKVVRARLSDALYFWKTDQADLPDLHLLKPSAEKFGLDLRKPLDQRMARLDKLGVTFHAKLGTQGERVERIARLAEELAPIVGADPKLARRAAILAKADLQTEVVGEFPELQGAMGRKDAALQGENPSVAAAIEEHYKPQGPSDRVPTDPVSVTVALADKLDTLVGFWAIDEKPTGSKDPYALRRAALGVIRILIENGVRLPLTRIAFIAQCSLLLAGFDVEHGFRHLLRRYSIPEEDAPTPNWDEPIYWTLLNADGFLDEKSPLIGMAQCGHPDLGGDPNSEAEAAKREEAYSELWGRLTALDHLEAHLWFENLVDKDAPKGFAAYVVAAAQVSWLKLRLEVVANDLLSFFHDRLKVYLRDQGARHDLIDAVLASEARHLPLEGGGRREAAGGGDLRGSVAAHPTPDLRSDPPPQGEGKAADANDDLLTIVRRVEALGSFLSTDNGKNLLAGTKRAANILAAEEKKGTAVAPSVDPALFQEDAERKLDAAVNQAEKEAGEAIQKEDFSAALAALSALREPVDSFFERVLVNDEDHAVRANRLALLARIRAATSQVADFSKIAG